MIKRYDANVSKRGLPCSFAWVITPDLQQLVHKTSVFNGLSFGLLHDNGMLDECVSSDRLVMGRVRLPCVQVICLASCCAVAMEHLGQRRRECRTLVEDLWLWCWLIACFKRLRGYSQCCRRILCLKSHRHIRSSRC